MQTLSRNIYIVWAVVVMFLTTTASCDVSTVYDRYEHTSVAGWEKADTLAFHVPKVRDEGLYSQYVGVRINGLYPFTGLTLIVNQRILPSNQVLVDTLSCKFHARDGLQMANGVGYFQYRFLLKKVKLANNDSLVVTIRHDMKREILPGIANVGVRVSRD